MTTAITPVKQDVYTIVSNYFISLLEKDIIPWHTSCAKTGIPRNLISGEPYTGLNVWLLASLNYSRNFFLTGKQIKSIGALIKKGEKGHLVIYMTPDNRLRFYKVFNIAQCRDIPTELLIDTEETWDPIKTCSYLAAAMPKQPKVHWGGSSVFYRYETDTIEMPDNEFFTNDETYYSNLFYALVLSTGHEQRLNRTELLKAMRIGTPKMGTSEELLAEMGSSYLCSYAGIAPVHLLWDRFAVEGWLFKLRTDSRFLIEASIKAEEAVNFILNIVPSGTQMSLDDIEAEDDIE
jgi:antirestriction protein ArdC